MKNKFLKIIQTRPIFLILLPFFFVLHGLIRYYDPGIIMDAIILYLVYITASVLIAITAWLYLRQTIKAAFFSFIIIGYNFFFGSCYDFIKKISGDTFFLKYSFLIPVTVIVFLTIVLLLKKSKKSFERANSFLNYLFIILIFIDIIRFLTKLSGSEPIRADNLSGLFLRSNTSKPDIYLIVADEYAGKKQLRDLFHFDNIAFEDSLKTRGFFVMNHSLSNYNATTYSMASMFSMGYIRGLKDSIINHQKILSCREIINNNNLLHFFNERKYTTYNCSPFTFNKKKKAVFNPFFPTWKSLLTSETFLYRIKQDIGYKFASKKNIEKIIRYHYYNNKKIDSLTRMIAANETGPKFVYTHLAMPHYPYYFDRNGNEVHISKINSSFKNNREAYIDYLLYSNKKLLSLVDYILLHSSQPPIILLISDHGFRQYGTEASRNYQFMNLNAVLVPDRNYTGFYDGQSNINEFRIILNSQFGQKLPLLKDSTSFVVE